MTKRKVVIPEVSDIQIVKEVSPDGGITWQNANIPPGVSLPLTQKPVYRYTVKNTGTVTLSLVTVTDNVLGLISLGAVLQPGESVSFEKTGSWLPGQHCNTATATGAFRDMIVSDTDSACYSGTSVPIFPTLPAAPPQEWIIDYLLETIAFEELALAALVNAEAEKIQAVVAAGVLGPVEPDAMESVNRSVKYVINKAAAKEELLLSKLSRILAHKNQQTP